MAEDNQARYAKLAQALSRIAAHWHVNLVLAEMPHGGAQSSRAASAMAAAAAIVGATFAVLNIPLVAVRPLETKRLTGAAGKVEKKQVIEYVARRYGRRLIPADNTAEHVADAMACVAVLSHRKNGQRDVSTNSSL